MADQPQQLQLVERIQQLSALMGPHHLRDLVRSSINVLLVQPVAAECGLQAWGEFLAMGGAAVDGRHVPALTASPPPAGA